jgi:hypothetical protein
MSIKAYITELEALQKEKTALNAKKAQLNKRYRELVSLIDKYFQSKNQPGAKFNNCAVIVEHKTTHKNISEKIRDSKAQEVLQKYGITDPEAVLEELLKARKGEAIVKPKLKIKKFKSKN